MSAASPREGTAARAPGAPRPWRAVVATGALLGLLDLAFACAFWWPRGVAPLRIAQSIGAGWFGERSYRMGAASAAAGLASHFAIAIAFVLAYRIAATRAPILVVHPWRFGLAYGVCLYLAMNLVVLPLSAAGAPGFGDLPWVASSVVVHALLGALCAFGARRSLRTD